MDKQRWQNMAYSSEQKTFPKAKKQHLPVKLEIFLEHVWICWKMVDIWLEFPWSAERQKTTNTGELGGNKISEFYMWRSDKLHAKLTLSKRALRYCISMVTCSFKWVCIKMHDLRCFLSVSSDLYVLGLFIYYSHEADTGQIKLLSRYKVIIQSQYWLKNNLQTQQFLDITHWPD